MHWFMRHFPVVVYACHILQSSTEAAVVYSTKVYHFMVAHARCHIKYNNFFLKTVYNHQEQDSLLQL